MLLFRSIFWLTLAYLAIKPGVDFQDSANRLAAQALASGQQVVATQVHAIECDSLQCAGGKAMLAAVLPNSPSAGVPMHDQPASPAVPYPRPRPDWAG